MKVSYNINYFKKKVTAKKATISITLNWSLNHYKSTNHTIHPS